MKSLECKDQYSKQRGYYSEENDDKHTLNLQLLESLSTANSTASSNGPLPGGSDGSSSHGDGGSGSSSSSSSDSQLSEFQENISGWRKEHHFNIYLLLNLIKAVLLFIVLFALSTLAVTKDIILCHRLCKDITKSIIRMSVNIFSYTI